LEARHYNLGEDVVGTAIGFAQPEASSHSVNHFHGRHSGVGKRAKAEDL
jgi:hypothetical protein